MNDEIRTILVRSIWDVGKLRVEIGGRYLWLSNVKANRLYQWGNDICIRATHTCIMQLSMTIISLNSVAQEIEIWKL